MRCLMQRPSWQSLIRTKRNLDLSHNTHYDIVLKDRVKQILSTVDTFHDYPHQVNLYESISRYYNIPLDRLTIGYGGTEILERIFKSLEFNTVYVVEPCYRMINYYCGLYTKNYIAITVDDLQSINPVRNSILVIANPNGVNGEAHYINEFIDKFKYVISDEVYGDFYPKISLIGANIDNVIIVKSFSKSLGLGGFRCGFAIAPHQITDMLQLSRSNVDMTSFSSLIIPKIIDMTPGVIQRMTEAKLFLEQSYECKPSAANYVLFKEPNKYTETFGSQYLDGHYRMALTNMEVLENGTY